MMSNTGIPSIEMSDEVGNYYRAPESDFEELEEESDDESVEIKKPFNPEEISISTKNSSVHLINERIINREIDLFPDWQRNVGIWDDVRKSLLIESLMLRIPIPVFYVAAQEDDTWLVVDGIQRMSTISDFISNKFKLKKLEYLSDYEGRVYEEIPRKMQRRINETELIVNVIDPRTPPEVRFNLFKRINTGGLVLNGQEIRHALNPGKIRNFLMELSGSVEFKLATDNSIDPKRMADRECVLRFLAFRISDPKDYSHKDLDGLLVKTMQEINKLDTDSMEGLKRDFYRAMVAARSIFNTNAFRKPESEEGRKKPISKALFEVWSVSLARCSSEEIETLVIRKEDLIRNFANLFDSDPEFERSVTYSTGITSRIRKRFETIDNLVDEVIG